MSNKNIIIRQASIKDREAIWSFLQLAYGENSKYKFPERWNWQYLNNPFWEEENLPLWIAIKDGKVIGQSNALIIPLKIDSKIVTAGWSTDTNILPEYRGFGLGTKLQHMKLNYIKNYMAINIAVINRKIMYKIGARPGNPAYIFRKYFMVTEKIISDSLLFRTNKNRFLTIIIKLFIKYFNVSKILAYLFNRYFQLINYMYKAKEMNRDIQIEKINSFNDDIDNLWHEINKEYSIITVRTQDYLNWKYCSQPDINYNIYIAKREKKTCGYSVLRKCKFPEPNKGIIADLFVSRYDKKTIDALIDHAVTFFNNEVDMIECGSTISEFKLGYKRHGFTFKRFAIPAFYTNCVENWDELIDDDGWYLVKASSDWDQYPYG